MTLAMVPLAEARRKEAAGPEGWPEPLADEAYHGLADSVEK